MIGFLKPICRLELVTSEKLESGGNKSEQKHKRRPFVSMDCRWKNFKRCYSYRYTLLEVVVEDFHLSFFSKGLTSLLGLSYIHTLIYRYEMYVKLLDKR